MQALINRLLDWAAKRIRSGTIHAFAAVEPPGPNEPPEPVVIEVVRLRPDLVDALERRLPSPYVGPTTTDLMAGYQLGVQAVLQQIRNGYATH